MHNTSLQCPEGGSNFMASNWSSQRRGKKLLVRNAQIRTWGFSPHFLLKKGLLLTGNANLAWQHAATRKLRKRGKWIHCSKAASPPVDSGKSPIQRAETGQLLPSKGSWHSLLHSQGWRTLSAHYCVPIGHQLPLLGANGNSLPVLVQWNWNYWKHLNPEPPEIWWWCMDAEKDGGNYRAP